MGILTTKADPTGQTFAKPLMPNRNLSLELHLGGYSLIKSERFDKTKHPLVLEVIKNDYRRIRQEDLERGSNHYLKMLGALEQQYERFGLTADDFIPEDLPKEKPLKPSTVITENFNQPDSTTLGPNLSWTEIFNDWNTISNELQDLAANEEGQARANSDLSTSNMYAQITRTVLGISSWIGPGVRMPSTATRTAYYGLIFDDGNYYHRKIIEGTFTTFSSATGNTAVPATWKETADGSTITLYRDDVLVHQQTDTSITGNLRGGVLGYNTLARGDNFEAGDLAAGGGAVAPPITQVIIWD